MDAIFDRRTAELAEATRRWRAAIDKLGPDSPLEAWLEYVDSSLHQQGLDGARRANSRQADAVRLLDDGRILRLTALWQLELSVTPALCAAYNRALHRLATTDDPYESDVGSELEEQLPNVKFFVAADCDLASGLDATVSRVRKIAELIPAYEKRWTQILATLGALRRGH
jgi:hypothetical protein